MENDLYAKLLDAYNEENLTRISSRLIELYKDRQFEVIIALARRINGVISINEKKVNKIFSKLIMLYHPDRLNYYLQEIERNYRSGNAENLHRLSHILLVLDKNQDVFEMPSIDLEEIFPQDYSGWLDDEDLAYFTDLETSERFNGEEPLYEEATEIRRDFFSAFKRKEYGNLDIDLFYHHLAEMDGNLDLADYEIDDLTGVEHCINIISLDLSDNNIVDISNLYNLRQLHELYLSNNYIEEIGILARLHKLRIIDLSCNQIENIQPLFFLDDLEYLNLSGNPVPEEQIRELEDDGVVVVF